MSDTPKTDALEKLWERFDRGLENGAQELPRDWIAFSRELESYSNRLLLACEPFVRIANTSSGRIPYERLSAAHWHELCKASAALKPKDGFAA